MTRLMSRVGPSRITHEEEGITADAVIRNLHGLVTYGPWDLDIASAMSLHGYDEVKWTEGQGMLAELVDSDTAPATIVMAAMDWYNEAAMAAHSALATRPRLLAKLGLDGGQSQGVHNETEYTSLGAQSAAA